MNEGRKRALWISISVVVLSILITTCMGSFSLVWIQHEIASVAKQTVLLEKRHQEMMRKLNYLDERIAQAHQPIALQTKVSHQLAPVDERRIVWVETTASEAGAVYVDAQTALDGYFDNRF